MTNRSPSRLCWRGCRPRPSTSGIPTTTCSNLLPCCPKPGIPTAESFPGAHGTRGRAREPASGQLFLQRVHHAVEGTVVARAPDLEVSAYLAAVAGVHFGGGVNVERPGLTAILREIHSSDAGEHVAAGSPSGLRIEEAN